MYPKVELMEPILRKTVKVEVRHLSIRIYINDALHLLIKLENLIGIQSWINRKNNYSIEYSMKDGAEILSEYDDLDLWKSILEQLDKIQL